MPPLCRLDVRLLFSLHQFQYTTPTLVLILRQCVHHLRLAHPIALRLLPPSQRSPLLRRPTYLLGQHRTEPLHRLRMRTGYEAARRTTRARVYIFYQEPHALWEWKQFSLREVRKE